MACVNRAKISFTLAKFIINEKYVKYARGKREEVKKRVSLWSFSTAASLSSTRYSFIAGKSL
jgi:hypothetical protein